MKTFSQIKSNVAVPIKKKVFFCRALNKNAFCHSQPFTLTFPVFHTSQGFEVSRNWILLSLHLFILILFCIHPIQTQSSIPLPSRSRRTKRRSVWRGGCWMSCTKYSWTQTLSTTAWPTTWQTVCSVRETRTSPTYPCGNRFGEKHISQLVWLIALFFNFLHMFIGKNPCIWLTVFILCERWMTGSSGTNTWSKTLLTFR